MKRIKFCAAMGFLLMTALDGTAKAQDTRFTFVNNTAYTVNSVYIWPSNAYSRGPDRLGSRTVESGESHSFRPRDNECIYNIRVRLQNNIEEEWDELDLCEMQMLELQFNYRTGTLSASAN